MLKSDKFHENLTICSPLAGPIPSPGCPWQFGIFEDGTGKCAVTYAECAWGVPHRKYCEPKGLVYDERIKGCNWPDEVGCASESELKKLSFRFLLYSIEFFRFFSRHFLT